MNLKPFWRYYGGKWRAAPHYPAPVHGTIIEPFAGAAGYSMRYFDRNVILVDKYPTICEMWRYLIAVTSAEIRRIPEVDDVDALPDWVPVGGRKLVGFSMNSAAATPRKTLSAERRKRRALHHQFEGWTPSLRERVASQVEYIRHWRIIEGDWEDTPVVTGTWFVDPPYNNRAGSHYVHHHVDYDRLAQACGLFPGQVIVCENEGASWLPFRSFQTFKAQNSRETKEVIWERAA